MRIPIFSVKHADGRLFWFDLAWGNTWSEGCGYIGMVEWGKNKENKGHCRDNRQLIDLDDCIELELLGWSIDDERVVVPRLIISMVKSTS